MSPAAVLRKVSMAETSAANAGYSGIDVYVLAEGVSREAHLDFGPGGPLPQIPTQGVIRTAAANPLGRRPFDP